jgi:sugar/nucleoside kinase (ribokinase family)
VRPLLVLARVIIDDLYFTDGSVRMAVPGGAGLYAAAGAAVWWPKVALVAGVGIDIHAVTDSLLLDQRFILDGLAVLDPHTVRSALVYLESGGRTETSRYGQVHFDRLETGPSDIPQALLPAAGIYIFRDAEADFWTALSPLRPELGAVLWELNAASAIPSQLAAIHAALPCADIFSLNLAESIGLFGDIAPDETLDRLLDAGARLVVLRMGALGALAATPTQRLRVRPPATKVIDETGAGNSFCGGFLAAWCAQPGDIAHALRCAAAAAASTLQQAGPPGPAARHTAPTFAAAALVDQVHATALP